MAITLELKSEFIELNESNWIQTSNEFNFKWQFPNCLGAVDGKHIAIRKPKDAGSDYFNYKRFHSIVLMAIAAANYSFITIDVGAKGAEGDANVFARTEIGRMIKEDCPNLNLPPDALVGNQYLQYFFIGDDAFPLTKRIMKPYSPNRRQKVLTPQEIVFNYRLSRARRCVENAFGILVSKWACVGKTFHCDSETAKNIVAACCSLHNYMINRKDRTYIPERFKDIIDSEGEYVQGIWRSYNNKMCPLQNNIVGRPNEMGVQSREVLKNFVNSTQGKVSFQ